MKIGLALEGGGLKGIYSAGILDQFMEKNIDVSTMIGVSAGALFGINVKSNQKGRALRYNLKYCKNKNYMGIYSLIKTGDIMNKDFCFNKLVYELDPFDFETFKNNKIDFYCVVTNCLTGNAEYINLTDLSEIDQLEFLRATGSMPFVSKFVNIKNTPYLDGALADSIPLEELMKHDLDKFVVILTKPLGYRKHKSNQMLAKMKYKKYPNLVKTINLRYEMYNKQMELIEKLEKEGKIFVFRPSLEMDVSRLEKNKEKIQMLYDLGKKDFLDLYDSFMEYLNA